MILTISGVIIIGVIAGLLARALVRGKDSLSVFATILLGLVGSFVGGLLASLLFVTGDGEDLLQPSSLVGSIVGAILALLIYNVVTSKQRPHV